MSIYVVRAFGQLKQFLASNAQLAKRLDELEAKIDRRLGSHDSAIAALLAAVRQLANIPPRRQRRIGFTVPLDDNEQ